MSSFKCKTSIYVLIGPLERLTQAPNPYACSNIIQVPLSPGLEYKIVAMQALVSVKTVPLTLEADVNFSKIILLSCGHGVASSFAVHTVNWPKKLSVFDDKNFIFWKKFYLRVLLSKNSSRGVYLCSHFDLIMVGFSIHSFDWNLMLC